MSEELINDSFIVTHINRRVTRCLLDSGSRYSLASLSWCQSHNIPIKPLEFGQQTNLWSANGSPLQIHGSISLDIRIKGLNFPTDLLVISDLSDQIILGTNFMSTYNVILDYTHGTVQLDDLLSVPLVNKESRQRVVRAIDSVYIPPFSEAILPVAVHKRFIGRNVLLEASPTHACDKFATARIIVKPQSVSSVCRILNYQSVPIVIRKGECVAVISNVFTDSELQTASGCAVNRLSSEMPTKQPAPQPAATPVPTPTREDLDNFIKRTGIYIAEKAAEQDRYALAALLFEFQDLFKTSVKDIQQCNVTPFEIKLRSDKGAYTRQYKLTPKDAAEVESQLKDMLDAHVIEPATGVETQKFNAPIFLVDRRPVPGQPSPSKRVVLDYRKLNSIVEPVILNLPPVGDLVAEVAATHATIFSTLDVISFFWQLPLSPESRKATIFTSPSGRKFQFRVAPFGLCNSPGYSSLTLLSVLERLKGRIAFYVDDICVPSTSLSSHLLVLRDLFTELRKANLSLNGRKCRFLEDEAIYLSHKITKDGYTLVSKYSTDIIRHWGSPSNPTALNRWLNSAGWFRRHIPSFAKRTAPLRELLKAGKPYVWTDLHESIFRSINECMIQPPVLKPLDNTSKIYILTDASSEGCAYMIAQKGPDNRLSPCFFGGQALTGAQTRWPPYQQEIFSLILALQVHYSILSGREIVVVTDNASLQHFNSLHLNSSRLRRWHYLISQFSVSLIHLPGSSNSLLDGLSRQFADMPTPIKLQFTPQESDTDDYILRIKSADTDKDTDTPTEQDINDRMTYTIQWPADILTVTEHYITQLTESAGLKPDLIIPPPPDFSDSPINQDTELTVFIANTADKNAIFPRLDHSDSDTQQTANICRPIRTVPTRQQIANDSEQETVETDAAAGISINESNPDRNIDTPTDDNYTANTDDSTLLTEPDIQLSTADYLTDDEFGPIVEYLLHNKLTGHEPTDRRIIFTADSYFIMDDKLYRVTQPRSKRARNVSSTHVRLCIPRRFQFQTVENYHRIFNHCSHVNLLETLRPRLYFQDLPRLCLEIPRTCDRCSMVKRNQEVPRQPLHPREINSFNSVWHLDHLKLARRSSANFTHVFVAIEQFSSWPEAALCHGTGARETALRFLETVISRHSVPRQIVCDRATSFVNSLFTHLSELLGIQISLTASRNPMANSKVEREISRIKQAIKLHADKDEDIETVLPAVLMGLRMTRTRSTDTTPFYLSRGFHPSLPLLGSGPDEPLSPQRTLASKDKLFLERLTKNMHDMHAKVKENVADYKQQMKQQYDRAYKTAPAPYTEGSKVWLHSPQIKAGSKSVLTHKAWKGPFWITQVHKPPDDDSSGVTYILTDCKTGKTLKHPVSALRLKPSHSREALIERLYPEQKKPVAMSQENPDSTAQATSQAVVPQSDETEANTQYGEAGYEPAIKIIRQRKVDGKIQFLVVFTDRSRYWCDANDCSEQLIKHYRLMQARRRGHKRRRGHTTTNQPTK